MRYPLALFPLLLATASCSGGNDDDRSGTEASPDAAAVNASEAAADMAAPEERAAGGPNVAPTAAPGVAFNYRYAFGLAADRVAEVQEQHAGLCEQLGPNRCRITGMVFRRVNERDIEARLEFKLEPSIARRFGRDGIALVARADGTLIESQIAGVDVGTSIRRAGRSIDEMNEELRRIEARLAGRLPAGERSNLEYEAQQLRASIRAARESRQEAQESLATTPMVFEYGSGRFFPGSEHGWPLRETWEQARENVIAGLSILFIVLVTLLPWAALALLAWLAGRWLRRRGWMGGPRAAAAAEPAG